MLKVDALSLGFYVLFCSKFSYCCDFLTYEKCIIASNYQ